MISGEGTFTYCKSIYLCSLSAKVPPTMEVICLVVEVPSSLVTSEKLWRMFVNCVNVRATIGPDIQRGHPTLGLNQQSKTRRVTRMECPHEVSSSEDDACAAVVSASHRSNLITTFFLQCTASTWRLKLLLLTNEPQSRHCFISLRWTLWR